VDGGPMQADVVVRMDVVLKDVVLKDGWQAGLV